MRYRRLLGAFSVLVSAAALGACGDDDGDAGAGATDANTLSVIDVSMTDMAFSPNSLTVARGDVVTFRFHNDGAVVHEAVIGDEGYQNEHAGTMTTVSGEGDGAAHGGVAHGATGDGPMVAVAPGETGELTFRFDEARTMLIGCHQPGHYEAGMKATIDVA